MLDVLFLDLLINEYFVEHNIGLPVGSGDGNLLYFILEVLCIFFVCCWYDYIMNLQYHIH